MTVHLDGLPIMEASALFLEDAAPMHFYLIHEGNNSRKTSIVIAP